MQTWKLSIKPDSKKSVNPLDICRNKSLIGVGWHYVYHDKHPSSFEEAKELVIKREGKWPHPLKRFCEQVEENDFVWIHQSGHYYLCKVKNNKIILGRDIVDNFKECDLGHAREAEWVEIPEKFISGSVQRGIIPPGIIQRIRLTKEQQNLYSQIFDRLKSNPKWQPDIDKSALSESLKKTKDNSKIFSVMSPEDLEDIVAAYLQSSGWVIIKSTCYPSKPEFEFSMLDRKGDYSKVQVKSGKKPSQLEPIKYKDHAEGGTVIFLFSTHENPYPGPKVKNVIPIMHDELIDWMVDNVWCLTLSLKYRLWTYYKE